MPPTVVARCQQGLEKFENDLTHEMDWELMDTKEHDKARVVSLLGTLVQGRLVGLIKNLHNFNGHKALRHL